MQMLRHTDQTNVHLVFCTSPFSPSLLLVSAAITMSTFKKLTVWNWFNSFHSTVFWFNQQVFTWKMRTLCEERLHEKNQEESQHLSLSIPVFHSSNAASKPDVQASALWPEEISLLHTPPECPCKDWCCFGKVYQVSKHAVGKKMGPENLDWCSPLSKSESPKLGLEKQQWELS